MAEAALLGLAKSVLGQLSTPALNEFLLLWNSKKDLKKLGETIETIKCFIHDAERKQSNEDLVKLWLSRLRAVLYDADDLFDTIAAMALRKKAIGGSAFKKEVTLFFSKSNQLGFVIKTAHEIKVIRECLDGIEKDMSTCKLQYHKIEEKRPHNVLEREERHSYVDSKEVIGRDKEKEEIVELLMREDDRQQNLEVISVIGFGGLGKTTLAQLVYNDPRVQKGFDLCLWTCINYLSDLESVLVKILNSKPRDLHLDQLQRGLSEKIQGKKYLLVVDDVWDENPTNWSRLKTLLNCGKIGSKVLITTRKTRVAQCLDAVEPYYRLNVLSEESAWFLFVKMAFKDDEFDYDAELFSIGKQILHKCGYVPLDVSIIGSMLRYRKKDKEEWKSFMEKELVEVVSNDASYGNQVLKVSYNDLPLALKHCFAYCSIFPKDHVYEKDDLVRMWIAQGFVEPHVKKSLEEVGEDYFVQMVDRCFFQMVNGDSRRFNDVKYACIMHDSLHDLAIQVAGSESKCFMAEDLRDMVEMSALRHISVTCLPKSSHSKSFYCNLSFHSKSLRTLRFIDALHIDINSLVLDRFRKLRTLDLSYLNFRILPDSFEGLIHLRYLDLSYNSNLSALPNSICSLHYLQTLNLEGCVSLKELPFNFFNLLSLRHLFLEKCFTLSYLPSVSGDLTSLVTLDRLIVSHHHGGLRYLRNLNSLRGVLTIELPLEGWPNCKEDATESNMSNKRELHGMNIRWLKSEADTTGKIEENEAKEVLEALVRNNELAFLNIDGYVGDALSTWNFVTEHLQELVLTDCSFEYLGYTVSNYDRLARLKTIKMTSLTGFKGWKDIEPQNDHISRPPSFPGVSKVVIQDCSELTENVPLLEGAENMQLLGVNVKLVEGLLTANGSFSASSSASTSECQYNSKLVELQLHRVDGLNCLHRDWIKHLTALKKLCISGCSQLEKVSSRGLACLTALESLSIFDCGAVNLEDLDFSGLPWKRLQRLRDLTVPWGMINLQRGLQYLTALERLEIHYCGMNQDHMDNQETELFGKGLKNLGQIKLKFGGGTHCCPPWIKNLRFLKELEFCDCEELSWSWTTLINMKKLLNLDFIKVKNVTMTDAEVVEEQNQLSSLKEMHVNESEKEEWIHNIPWKLLPSLRILSLSGISNLKSLPNGIQHLTSLDRLTIGDCSKKLKNRCRRKGEDWPLISRITDVDISESVMLSS